MIAVDDLRACKFGEPLHVGEESTGWGRCLNTGQWAIYRVQRGRG
ncbi:MAG: hypothetical protein U0X87_12580 [Anaerolineales bacterium]